MWIKQVELKNFQKHEHLVLDFTSEVNAIYGATDTGKSCVRRAIEWVVFNKTLRNDAIRREDTKQTSVKVTRENGTVIERIKSNSINRYLLTVDGETEEFNSIGKTIPEKVQEALGVSPIEVDKEEIVLNIANQISLPFLLDKSPTFRMKLFNKITGNDVVDQVLQSFNKDLLGISKKEKLQIEEIEKREEEQKEVEDSLNKKTVVYNQYKDQFDILQEKAERLTVLTNYSDKLKNIKIEQSKIVVKEEILLPKETIESLQVKIDKMEKLDSSSDKLKDITQRKGVTEKLLDAVRIPKINTETLKKVLSKFEKLLVFKERTETLNKKKSDLESALSKSEETKASWVKKYKEFLLKSDRCPTCKQKLDSKTIGELEI